MRPVHACSKCVFKGMSIWFNRLAKSQFAKMKLKHNFFSTDDFQKEILSWRFEVPILLVHLDIDDFFNIGNSNHHCKHAPKMLPNVHRSLLERCITFLLDHQFIRSATNPDIVFQSSEGSGQGLPHSGYLSNLSFLHAAE